MNMKIFLVFLIASIVIACAAIGNYLYAIGEVKGAIAYLLIAIFAAFLEHHVIETYQTEQL